MKSLMRSLANHLLLPTTHTEPSTKSSETGTLAGKCDFGLIIDIH